MRDDELSSEDAEVLTNLRRATAEDTARVAPPADLWSRIESAAGARLSDEASATAAAGRHDDAPSQRVGRRRWIAVAGGLAAAAVAAGALWLVTRDDDTSSNEVASVVLSNDGLASFPVAPHGTARLIEENGRYVLDVDVVDLDPQDEGYYEIWMIDRNVQGMVSLGPYHGRDRYAVPVAVDPATFPVVDVSFEPVDGTPTHSGVSAVRGVLPL